jgi:antirestriction protein ArdC
MKADLKRELYERVTSGLIEQMEAGVVVWQQPWVVSKAYQPQNGVSGHLYSGFNRIYLGMLQSDLGTSDPRWFTLKGANKLGYRIAKGSKGATIVYNKRSSFKKEDDVSGETVEKSYWLMRYYTVYHASQVIGLPEYDADVDVPVQPDQDEVFAGIGVLDSWCHDNLRSFEYGGNRACYVPSSDAIMMPLPDSFKRQSWFGQTLAHEVVHATGNAKRLDRLKYSGFGTSEYAKEELIAEFGAAMLCGAIGIPADVEQSAAYMKSWAARCREEPSLLVSAANAAERASDFVLDSCFVGV